MARAVLRPPLTFPFFHVAAAEGNGNMRTFNHFAPAVALLCLAAPTLAQDRPVLSIYAPDSFAAEWGPGPGLKAGFEAQCACTVEFSTGEDGISTLRKIQLEGPASRADVLLGIDTTIAAEARATGLFAPHGVDTAGLALSAPWTDAEFVPFDYGYFAYVYNSETVPNPPRSFEELIALPDDFKIVVQDPRSSTPGFGHVIWIASAYGERAPEIWAGLKPHILTVTRGWSESWDLFLAGEADMVLSYTTSPAYNAVMENDTRYAYAPFAEGHVAQIELGGVLAGADQPELARQFLAYLITPEAQKLIPTTNWMYPVADIGDALPAAFAPPPEKVIAVDESVVAANGRAWVDAALAALQ
jgi:thiamine transport system substrate-binding protein